MLKYFLIASAVAAALPLAGGAILPPTGEIKSLAFGKEPRRARALFESRVPGGRLLGAEWLEAMSWVARAGAIGGDWDQAAEYSERTLDACERLLETRPLDADPEAPLPIALGAAIETMGKFYAAMGDRGRAVTFLRDQSAKYAGTSVETRLVKNLLLLDLAGKPMPDLAPVEEWLGEVRFDPADLKGKVTLFFFWAHWCEDCRAQKPVVLGLKERFEARGLRIVAPTRLYGYLEDGRDIGPAAERDYIMTAHVARGELFRSVPVPLSRGSFVSFGVSSTPTLILVDRSGMVRLYHPGQMQGAALAREIESLL